jgi:hypothetical protein
MGTRKARQATADDFAAQITAAAEAYAAEQRTNEKLHSWEADALAAIEKAKRMAAESDDTRKDVLLDARLGGDLEAQSKLAQATEQAWRLAREQADAETTLAELRRKILVSDHRVAFLKKELAIVQSGVDEDEIGKTTAELRTLITTQASPLIGKVLELRAAQISRAREALSDDAGNTILRLIDSFATELRELLWQAGKTDRAFTRALGRPTSWERARIPATDDPDDDGEQPTDDEPTDEAAVSDGERMVMVETIEYPPHRSH